MTLTKTASYKLQLNNKDLNTTVYQEHSVNMNNSVR